jgi:hypothetical protein
MIIASSKKNWAKSLLIHTLLELKVGSLYFGFALDDQPNFKWNVSFNIIKIVDTLGTLSFEKLEFDFIRSNIP